MLGKRKRRSPERPEKSGALEKEPQHSQDEGMQAVFRRYFENHFEPLDGDEQYSIAREDVAIHTSEDEKSDWSGLSGSEDEPAIEVVDQASSRPKVERLSREELKSFMLLKTAKPPTTSSKPKSTAKRKATADEAVDIKDDAANIKNDLALQRLLNESHLLDASTSSSLTPLGGNRHKAIDLRLQTMGSKSSILAQNKMPMSHRKGIMAKAAEREGKRRKEAKENGIVLEKVKKAVTTGEPRRERGIGAPGVGRFSGGMLKLSKRDVASIEGPKKRSHKGAKGRRK